MEGAFFYFCSRKQHFDDMNDSDKKSIKEWAADDRPREKMMAKGKTALSNAELVAILIGSGNSEMSAVELARLILDSVGNNLIDLSNLSLDELMQFKGIGEAKAVSIMAALELGSRRRSAEAEVSDKVLNSMDAYERFLPHIANPQQENFLVMFMTTANKVIKIEHISAGGMTETVVDPKIIFKKALNANATAVVLCHNHPSGSVSPSREDDALTRKFIAAGMLLDIVVRDHIIIGQGCYYSYLEHDRMKIS